MIVKLRTLCGCEKVIDHPTDPPGNLPRTIRVFLYLDQSYRYRTNDPAEISTKTREFELRYYDPGNVPIYLEVPKK